MKFKPSHPGSGRVAPGTGRLPGTKYEAGLTFLKEVNNPDLRSFVDFMSTPIYAFLVTHFEKERRNLEKTLGGSLDHVRDPIAGAHAVGVIDGLKLFSILFQEIKGEWKQRLDRDALEQTSGDGDGA